MKKRNLSLWLAVSTMAIPVVVAADTTEELSNAAKSVKTTLSKLTNSSSKTAVTNARSAYDKLNEDDKYSIYDIWLEKLIPLEVKFFTLDVEALITKKDTVKITEIEKLQSLYNDKEWEFQDLAQDASSDLYALQEYVENKPYREAAAQFVKQLENLTEVTITRAQYEDIAFAYESLEYELLQYIDVEYIETKLALLQNALYKFEAAIVQKMIDEANEDNSTEETLNKIIIAYDNLSYEVQEMIVNYDKIEQLQQYIWDAPYREEAIQFMKKLDSLQEETITQVKYDEITLAYASLDYNTLDYIDVAIVDKKIENFQLALYKSSALSVQQMIDEANKDNSTEETLNAIIAAYDSLAYEAQEMIVNYDKIEQLQQYIWDAPYREEAAEIQLAIDSVDKKSTYDVLIELKDRIDMASYEAQELLQNVDKFEELIEIVKKNEIVLMQQMIDSITYQTVTSSLIEEIDEKYNSLHFDIQEAVTNYDKLQTWYDYLWNEEFLAFEVDAKIWALNEESSLQEVQEIYDEYDQLSDVAKSFIVEETVIQLQEILKIAGATEQVLNQQAMHIINAITAVWGSAQFTDNLATANDLFNNATATLQQKVTNQQTLVQYEVMSTFWQEKTKLWQPEVLTVSSTKEWKVIFSDAVLNTPENLANIKVFDEEGIEQALHIKVEDTNDVKGSQLIIRKATGTYEVSKQYVLIINENLKSHKNEKISRGVWQYFIIK